jgi:ribulose-phosphate 3-epimerase
MYNLTIMKTRISASILNADFCFLNDQILEVEKAGVEQLHIDIMDGHFVPNISVGPFIIQSCQKASSLPLDTHLMVENPDNYIESCATFGSTGISVHIENNPNIHRTLQLINSYKVKTGIVINPGTPIESIKSVLDLIDLILVMTVNPGFGGQAFIQSQLSKITAIKEMIKSMDKKPIIEVDGGINTQTLPLAYQAGADLFVVGAAIFSNPRGITLSIKELNEALK